MSLQQGYSAHGFEGPTPEAITDAIRYGDPGSAIPDLDEVPLLNPDGPSSEEELVRHQEAVAARRALEEES